MTKPFDPIHFLYPLSSRKPKKGSVLIAEPMMYAYYFERSVILLTEYSETGSAGFVLTNFASRQTEGAVEQASGKWPNYYYTDQTYIQQYGISYNWAAAVRVSDNKSNFTFTGHRQGVCPPDGMFLAW